MPGVKSRNDRTTASTTSAIKEQLSSELGLCKALDLSGPDQAREVLKGAVIGGLGVVRKTTGGKLPHIKMVFDAFAAYSLSGTRLIGAIASGLVLFLIAFHACHLLSVLGRRFACFAGGVGPEYNAEERSRQWQAGNFIQARGVRARPEFADSGLA